MKKIGFRFVYESLSKQIDCRLLTPGTQMPSENDLTGEFCVSRMTVRKALAQLEADGKIFRRTGIGTFVKAPEFKADDARKRFNIGIEAHPEWGVPRGFVSEVLSETQRACADNNCNLLLMSKEALFSGEDIDAAFLLFLDPKDLPRVARLAEKTPTLLLNRISDLPDLGYVAVDYVAETRRVVGRMLRNGAESILFVGGSGERLIYAPHMRELGYREAHAELGLPVREERIIPRDDCFHYQVIAERIQAERPDVIFVSCEYYLSRVYTALESVRSGQGKPIYVFSFDDTMDCSSFPAGSISCGRMPFGEMCRRAIRHLSLRAARTVPEQPLRELFPMTVIINNCPFLI